MKNKVAVIVDAFTLDNINEHWHVHEIDYSHALDVLETFAPSMLFVESVWHGVNGTWNGILGPKRKKLQEIIKFCNQKNIPTVFWNKEDPVHFDDFTERCDIAGLFDYIFSTEVDCVADYAEKYPQSHCFVLPFFFNEKKYTATTSKEHQGYFFAGTYYKKFPERNAAFENIMAHLSEAKVDVTIFDRNYGSDDPSLAFPEKYHSLIQDKVAASDMVSVYKKFAHCINLNTVQNGQTMFARRVIESLACSSKVLSNYSRALDVVFNCQRRYVAKNMVEFSPQDCAQVLKDLTSEKALSYIQSVVLEGQIPTEGLIAHLNALVCEGRQTLTSIDSAIEIDDATTNRSELRFGFEGGWLHVHSQLKDDEHGYINFSNQVEVKNKRHVHFIFDSSSSAALLDLWLLDSEGNLIFRNLYSRTQEINFLLPEHAATLKTAIRISGPHKELRCRLAFGKKIKIPSQIIPLKRELHWMKGARAEVDARLAKLLTAPLDIFYETGCDFDFSYQIIHGHTVVMGGELVKEALKRGQALSQLTRRV